RDGRPVIGLDLSQVVKERAQPATPVIWGAQLRGTLRGTRGNHGITPIGRVKLLPDGAKLVDIARAIQRFKGQRAQQALSRRLRKGLVL
uniref:hypothetical protein n=1 Tax=Salmonella enterica TaxID=28901 RepID=UPI0020C3415E